MTSSPSTPTPIRPSRWTRSRTSGPSCSTWSTNPATGALYVSNTDARNEVRFEGFGTLASTIKPTGEPATVRGHLAESRITVIQGGSVVPHHLNKHIDYDAVPVPAGVKEKSLATPVGMAVSVDGNTLYVAAFGSSAIGVFDTTQLENDTFTPDAGTHIAVSGGGPAGVVLRRRPPLHADSLRQRRRGHRPHPGQRRRRGPDPAAAQPRAGERGGGQALPLRRRAHRQQRRGLVRELPHLRRHGRPRLGSRQSGRRRGGERQPVHRRQRRAVPSDQGADDDAEPARPGQHGSGALARRPPGQLRTGASTPSMSPSRVWSGATRGSSPRRTCRSSPTSRCRSPTRPTRSASSTTRLRSDEQAGFDLYHGRITDSAANCNGCHTLDPANGFFGGNGNSSIEGETQEFKIPHLRNAYQKIGMFGMANTPGLDGDFSFRGDQIRGFGFLHDGSIDNVFRFTGSSVFTPQRHRAGQPGSVRRGLPQRPAADGRPADHAHQHERRDRRPAHRCDADGGGDAVPVQAPRAGGDAVRRHRQGHRRRAGARLRSRPSLRAASAATAPPSRRSRTRRCARSPTRPIRS